MQVSKPPLAASTAIVTAPMPTPSPLTRFPVRLALYGGGAIAVVTVTALVKYFLSRLAEYTIYPIPLLGGLLQSLELAELSNLLVFAILGLGFGALTRLLPVQWGQRLSAALLIVLVPLIFMISTQVRYDRWVQTVAEQEQLSRTEAIALTNAYLDDRIQSQGWWGFYRYTARYTAIPTSQAEMQRAMGIDARVQAHFAKVTGMDTPIVTSLMTLCSWGLRLFYFVIAAIVTISHFQEGLKPPVSAANRTPTAAPPVPSPVTPRRSPPATVAQRPAKASPKALAKTPPRSPAKTPSQASAKTPSQASVKAQSQASAKTPPSVPANQAKTPPKAPAKTQPGGKPQGKPPTQGMPVSGATPANPSRPPHASQPLVTDSPQPPRSEPQAKLD